MDEGEVELGHPDSMIRLASAVHRFRCPMIGDDGNKQKISFSRSFTTVGGHTTTRALMAQADACRASLEKALAGSDGGKTVSHKTISSASQNYIPLINRILLTCKVQPETARLDEKLVFTWSSGLEKDKHNTFTSEALMYELVMTLSTNALSSAGIGADQCIEGDFASASRSYKHAASILKFLSEDQLPKWVGRGSSVEEEGMPSEATGGICEAFGVLYEAVAQQMAVATVLVKPGSPNYGLVSKLCLGIAEHLDLFERVMRSKGKVQRDRMDVYFYLLVTLEGAIMRAFSMYFQAREVWDSKEDHGLAIRMMKEALDLIKTRPVGGSVGSTLKGLPAIDGKKCPLRNLMADIEDVRGHMNQVLRHWEKDNGSVYFDRVPTVVPEDKKLSNGMMIIKPDPFTLEEVEPAPLILPGENAAPTKDWNMDADERYARELQRTWNAGG